MFEGRMTNPLKRIYQVKRIYQTLERISCLCAEGPEFMNKLQITDAIQKETLYALDLCKSVLRPVVLADAKGGRKFTVAVEIPPMEDGGCSYSCPFLHHDDDGEYCLKGYGICFETKIKPGAGCPRWWTDESQQRRKQNDLHNQNK